ncbi:hypothetical protein IHE45_20G024200 [Dioscorea alata]|uniref:Uncharacterized protein n=1 Tax=Dioscorea alata TaxID=55571 RepID=A0ACB7TSL5_DIOAL|nr:hypothetical protein IHE45_20G024200 [Dioscorea alata]
MDKFLIKQPRSEESSNTPKVPLDSKSRKENINTNFNFNDIINFDFGIRNQVRREYLTRGPCQPIGHNFPQKDYGKQKRSFQDTWFKQHTWLEYSITKDPSRGSRMGEDAFTKMGFNNWKKALEKFIEHIVKFQGFQSQRQSVSHLLAAHSHEMEVAYRIRLTAQEVWKTVNQNAPGNNQLTSPKIQKELVNACATEITRVIIDDIGDSYFSLMIDEARDASNGHNAIDCLFAKHKMSFSRLRGKGYDGVSNMRCECNVIAAVTKDNRIMSDFFQYVNMIVNATRASCKRGDQLRQHHHDRLVEQLEKVEIVLQNVHDDGASNNNRGIVASLIDKMENYKFVFVMYLMSRLLGMTNELSLALQQKDQNIVQAMRLIEVTGWEEFLGKVTSFCKENSIDVPNMDDNMPIRGRLRREGQFITHFHHYHVEIYCEVIDLISQEMHNRFLEATTELLLLVSCLDPRDSFSKFNIHKLLRLVEMYLEDFSVTERMMLEDQLATFIYDVRHDNDFVNVGNLGGFAMKIVDTGKCAIFPLVYRLIELALVLSVATASVERAFLAKNVVKTEWHNKMGDKGMNDSIIVYIEKEVFATIDNETIQQCFQKMQTRRIQNYII